MDHLPAKGESVPVSDRRTVWGGTACNIARHAAGLGVPVRLWSRVGADFPADWRSALEADGVELCFDEGSRTPTCTIFTAADGGQSYAMDQGAMTPPYDVPTDVLDGIQWLHVSTGDPASYRSIVEAAKESGIRVALDPGQEIHHAYDEKSFFQMLELADVLFVNEIELEVAFKLCGYGDPLQFLDHVLAVVITRGADGADLVTEGSGIVHVDAPSVDAVDPTGAGDALRAGWYSVLHQDGSFEDALRMGVRAGAAAVTLQGAQPRALTLADLPQA